MRSRPHRTRPRSYGNCYESQCCSEPNQACHRRRGRKFAQVRPRHDGSSIHYPQHENSLSGTHSLSTHTHTHSPSAFPSAAATRSAARCLKTAASSRTIGSARVGRSRHRLRLRPPTPLSPPHAPSPSSRAPRLTAASATSSSASRRETVRRGHGVPNEG